MKKKIQKKYICIIFFSSIIFIFSCESRGEKKKKDFHNNFPVMLEYWYMAFRPEPQCEQATLNTYTKLEAGKAVQADTGTKGVGRYFYIVPEKNPIKVKITIQKSNCYKLGRSYRYCTGFAVPNGIKNVSNINCQDNENDQFKSYTNITPETFEECIISAPSTNYQIGVASNADESGNYQNCSYEVVFNY